MTIELDSALAQAEVLFLSFAQLLADADRRHAEAASTSSNLRRRATAGGTPPSNSSPDVSAKMRSPVIGEELRELLKTGR